MAEIPSTTDAYIAQVSEAFRPSITKLYQTINDNIPSEFQSCIAYKMLAWVVPFSIYPQGYHCNPDTPLPFVNVAAQKNFIAIYHMGLYADSQLKDWFVAEHQKRSAKKLDMGKSCIRYKKPEDIPFDLIAELFQKMNAQQWIDIYTKMLNASQKSK